MLHLAKLAVGIGDMAALRTVQAKRAVTDPPLRHRTRNFPRRADEVVNGGSIYWVIGGAIVVRQRILAIRRDHWEDGSACAALVLQATLVPVLPRPTRPFQGWRYLAADQAPRDFESVAAADGEAELPMALRQELRLLGLL